MKLFGHWCNSDKFGLSGQHKMVVDQVKHLGKKNRSGGHGGNAAPVLTPLPTPDEREFWLHWTSSERERMSAQKMEITTWRVWIVAHLNLRLGFRTVRTVFKQDLNWPDRIKTLRTELKLSRQYWNRPDSIETVRTVLNHMNCIETVQHYCNRLDRIVPFITYA